MNRESTRKVKCSGCAVPLLRAGSGGRPRCKRCKRNSTNAYRAAYRALHREEIRGYDAAWYRAHKDHRAATVEEWKRLHPERWAEINSKASKRYRRKEKKENEAVLHDLPCMDCGMKHTPETRQRILRRMLSLSITEIREAWPCVWTNERQLFRDKAQIRGAA